MKLEKIYRQVIKEGIKADIRSKEEIERQLLAKKREFNSLAKDKKQFFDLDNLFNPYADTRVLNGDLQAEINSIIAGIDVDTSELLFADYLKTKGKKIDLAISHHPQGRAYADFYEVMDLQSEIFSQQGISLSFAEQSVLERKDEVARKVHAANHQRAVYASRLLGINFMCMHTPCDNLAYRFMEDLMNREKPKTLQDIIDILFSIPEYQHAAKNNNAPYISAGRKNSKVGKIHIEFTGGTEGPKGIYEKLSSCGIDTIISMHQSEEHHKRAKEAKINVIVASHIASDSLGVNLMLDKITKGKKIKIYEFSGFSRIKRR